MEKSNQVATIIFSAAAALAIYKLYQMSKEERRDLLVSIRDKTHELLEDSEKTVEKVQHFVEELKSKNPDQWFDKLYLVKKMVNEFYGEVKPRKAALAHS